MNVKEKEIFKELLSLHLPVSDYVIFGSGPLFAHGIRSDVRDLDILARGSAWRKALTYGTAPVNPPSGNGSMIVLFDGRIEIFNSWVSAEWDVDSLIDNAEFIDGLPFVPLTTVLRWKKSAPRENDQRDILDIERYLQGHPGLSTMKYRFDATSTLRRS